MGRQITFYLADTDQADLARLIDMSGKALGMAQPISGARKEPSSIVEISSWRSGEHDPVIFLATDYDQLIYYDSGYKGTVLVDALRSPVIQFARCQITGKCIRQGRFFLIPRYWDDTGLLVEKPPAFLSWAKKLFSNVRKVCKKNSEGDYVGRDAQTLIAQGFELGSL